jgi:NaMN:DMB phosphoribosyltransferase
MGLLKETLNSIKPINKEAVETAWKRIDNLTKPLGSLGELEEIAAKMAGITGKTHNKINKKSVVIIVASAVAVNTAPKSIPACESMLGLTTSMYAIVMKVVIPARTSVLKLVLFFFNLKNASNISPSPM